MTKPSLSRRQFLHRSSAAAGLAAVPYYFSGSNLLADDAKAESKNDRPLIGCIGTGSRWGQIVGGAQRFGDVVAVCDVDRRHMAKAKERVGGKAAEIDDYRKLLERNDIDVVTIVTPDHWHAKIAIEAMQAGKDVYCEKPLTLTIDEGKKICEVVEKTGRVFQVGTQQRTEMGQRFLQAVALVHEGRLGKIKNVQCAIGGAPRSGPLKTEQPPEELDWEMWLGQAPLVDYIPNRCHYQFRWWYEYSGGKMTDWGAHHIDIAQWAIGMDESGPTSVEPVSAEHPVPFEDGYPTVDNEYNTATKFQVKCQFPNGVELLIRDDTENGILIEGDKGRIFVSRRRLSGKPVEELKDNPLPEDAITKVYKGKRPTSHMQNFFECIKTREQPISDVFTHHRAMTTCHLANIAIRLGRKLAWDPAAQQITGDDEANGWQSREQREGYEVKV